MSDLGKEPLDLLPGERFGQGTPAPDKVTGLDGIAGHDLLLQTKVKKMLQRIEPPVDRRPRAALLMLVLYKVVDLAKRHLGEGDRRRRKKHVQIEGITRDGMRRELPALEVRPKPIDGGLADIVHRLPLLEPLTLSDPAHGQIVLSAFGPIIQLGIGLNLESLLRGAI